MKKLLVTAALLLASSAAYAQYTFEYGGRTIRIDPDRGTVSIPGVYDNTGQGKNKKAKKNEAKPEQHVPQQTKVDPQAPPSSPATATTPVGAPSPAYSGALPPTAAAPAQPSSPPPSTNVKSAPANAVSAPSPDAASTAVTSAPQAEATSSAAISASDPSAIMTDPAKGNSPVGVWLTEQKEGKVRIEQCGASLCGYSVDKSNQNGEQVLINMKLGKDRTWSGRILDPNTGSTYDSSIAMRGTNQLHVQGCALGGLFCGGQTWTRLN